jgi:hypothetical protein
MLLIKFHNRFKTLNLRSLIFRYLDHETITIG